MDVHFCARRFWRGDAVLEAESWHRRHGASAQSEWTPPPPPPRTITASLMTCRPRWQPSCRRRAARCAGWSRVRLFFSEPVRGLDAWPTCESTAKRRLSLAGVASGPWQIEFEPAESGIVTIAWVANHGITDLGGGAEPARGGGLALQCRCRSRLWPSGNQ